MGTLWNTYAFFVLYANIDAFDATKHTLDYESLSVMDKWCLSRLNTMVKAVCKAAIKCHEKMGDFRLISWDFTVGTDGEPIFIEMNIKYGGTMYHQLSSGAFFGEDTDKMLNEIYAIK